MLNKKQRLLVEGNLGIARARAKHWFEKTPWDYDECESIAFLGLCIAAEIWDEKKGKLTTVAYRVIDNLCREEIRRANTQKRECSVVSLDVKHLGLGEQSLLDTLAVEDKYVSENSIVNVIPFLSESETFLLKERFSNAKSQMDVVKESGISRFKLQRTEKKLLEKVKRILEGDIYIGK